MLSLLRTVSSRFLRRRWTRVLLVVLSIALGVATMVATRSLNQSMAEAAHGAVTPFAGAGELLITNGNFGVPAKLAQDLKAANIPGVKAVTPLVVGRVALLDLDNRQALLLGVDPAQQGLDNTLGIKVEVTNKIGLISSKLFGASPVLVGTSLAAELQRHKAMDTLRVRAAGREQKLTGVGTVDAESGQAAMLGGTVLVMDLADAGKVVGQPDLLTRIDIALEPGSDRKEVQKRVTEAVAGRADVRTPEVNAQAVNDVVAGVELGFALGGVCALVVGLFLVYNSLSVSVAERRHDIGILRSLGATRGQIAGLFTVEAGLMGLCGSLLGIPIGFGLAHVALGPFQQILSDIFVPLESKQLRVSLDTIVLAISAGTLTALLAALVPAYQASSEEPADAVRRAPRHAGPLGTIIHIAACGLLIGGGFFLISLRDFLPPRAGTYGGLAIALVGLLLSTPLLAAVAAHLFRPIARLLFGIEVRLASDNLSRTPGRTGLVIGALAACVALMVQTAGVTQSSEDEVLTWVDRSIVADLFVTSNSPVTASSQNLPLAEGIGQQLEKLPAVNRAVPVRFQRTDYLDPQGSIKIVYLVALDAARYYDRERHRQPTPGLELFPRLKEPGAVLISENFATQHHVGVGDMIRLRGPNGIVAVKVIGTLVDYSWNRGTVFMDREQYRAAFDDRLVDVFDVHLEPEQDPLAVRAEMMRRWGAEQSLVVLTRSELRDNIAGMIRKIYGIGYAQDVVVAMVAALGVVTALLISVMQRRRELGLLRAVGASQAQVLRSVLAEAMLMGVIGSLIGILFGVALEWYAVQFLLPEEAGFVFPVRVPWQAAGIVVGGTLVLATLAGLAPAVQAMRLRIAEAIAHE